LTRRHRRQYVACLLRSGRNRHASASLPIPSSNRRPPARRQPP
jgi:hypothetical protein